MPTQYYITFMQRCQHQQKTIYLTTILPISQFIQYFFIIGENIFAHIVAGFESLNIKEDAWKTAVWTTDRAANMMATFSRHRRLDCVAHVINTCVRYTVAGDDTPLAVLRLITRCKGLVVYMKRRSFTNLLEHTLKNSVETRWNSHHTMLASIDKR